ncbi:Hypothetical predicted protein, partial [Marmota monax]
APQELDSAHRSSHSAQSPCVCTHMATDSRQCLLLCVHAPHHLSSLSRYGTEPDGSALRPGLQDDPRGCTDPRGPAAVSTGGPLAPGSCSARAEATPRSAGPASFSLHLLSMPRCA